MGYLGERGGRPWAASPHVVMLHARRMNSSAVGETNERAVVNETDFMVTLSVERSACCLLKDFVTRYVMGEEPSQNLDFISGLNGVLVCFLESLLHAFQEN